MANALRSPLGWTDKNDTLVKFSLPENQKNLIASKYRLYLPDEKQLVDVVEK